MTNVIIETELFTREGDYVYKGHNMKLTKVIEKTTFYVLYLMQNNGYAIVNDLYTYNRIKSDFKPSKPLEDDVIVYNLTQLSRKYDRLTYTIFKQVLTLTEATKLKAKRVQKKRVIKPKAPKNDLEKENAELKALIVELKKAPPIVEEKGEKDLIIEELRATIAALKEQLKPPDPPKVIEEKVIISKTPALQRGKKCKVEIQFRALPEVPLVQELMAITHSKIIPNRELTEEEKEHIFCMAVYKFITMEQANIYLDLDQYVKDHHPLRLGHVLMEFKKELEWMESKEVTRKREAKEAQLRKDIIDSPNGIIYRCDIKSSDKIDDYEECEIKIVFGELWYNDLDGRGWYDEYDYITDEETQVEMYQDNDTDVYQLDAGEAFVYKIEDVTPEVEIKIANTSCKEPIEITIVRKDDDPDDEQRERKTDKTVQISRSSKTKTEEKSTTQNGTSDNTRKNDNIQTVELSVIKYTDLKLKDMESADTSNKLSASREAQPAVTGLKFKSFQGFMHEIIKSYGIQNDWLNPYNTKVLHKRHLGTCSRNNFCKTLAKINFTQQTLLKLTDDTPIFDTEANHFNSLNITIKNNDERDRAIEYFMEGNYSNELIKPSIMRGGTIVSDTYVDFGAIFNIMVAAGEIFDDEDIGLAWQEFGDIHNTFNQANAQAPNWQLTAAGHQATQDRAQDFLEFRDLAGIVWDGACEEKRRVQGTMRVENNGTLRKVTWISLKSKENNCGIAAMLYGHHNRTNHNVIRKKFKIKHKNGLTPTELVDMAKNYEYDLTIFNDKLELLCETERKLKKGKKDERKRLMLWNGHYYVISNITNEENERLCDNCFSVYRKNTEHICKPARPLQLSEKFHVMKKTPTAEEILKEVKITWYY